MHYTLQPGEIVLLIDDGVKRGTSGSYNNELVLTNQQVVFSEIGMFGSIKSGLLFPFDIITQAAVGLSKNDSAQLQIVYGYGMESFSFRDDSNRKLKLWSMAINDQLSGDSGFFDASYYARFSEENLKKVSRKIESGAISERDTAFDLSILEEIGGSLLSSGDFSMKNLKRSFHKVGSNKSSSIGKNILKAIKDDIGITDIQNEFSEMLGMETEETIDERKERLLDAAFEYEVFKARKELIEFRQYQSHNKHHSQSVSEAAISGLDSQMEALRKLKSLLDEGILTTEEFEKKKKDVLNL